jgi:plasmid stabilization system protein ParE
MKHHKVRVPRAVNVALLQQANYISTEQQDPIMASRWLDGMIGAIQSLSHFPERCQIAPENFRANNNFESTIRQLFYKKSFRVIFKVVGDEVRILGVRHSARTIH